MASLYELTGNAITLNQLLKSGEADEAAIYDAILNNNEEIGIKLESYAKVIKNYESDIAGLKTEEKRLADKRKTLENHIASMKGAMQAALALTGQSKVAGQLFTFTIQKNPPSVVLDEPYIENIPDKYLIPQEPKIDRKLMFEDLKNNITLPDLEGIAHLEQTESLRIK